MLKPDLQNLITDVLAQKAESQTVELKAARDGCPTRLYDTLSSFSNQDDGGIILFGIDEEHDYEICGVYDVQDLQKHISEQCKQMSPQIRAVFTVCTVDKRCVVSAEIPALDVTERPCFYAGKGRLKGSYVRVGDADEPMNEYEIYSYEAFRKKYRDELEPVNGVETNDLDNDALTQYVLAVKRDRPNSSQLSDEHLLGLMGILHGTTPTLAAIMLFGLYPQATFPQLDIIATVVPGPQVGDVNASGERFTDNKRINGTLAEQLAGALNFVRNNSKTPTMVSEHTGMRVFRQEYPLEAVRELVLNALIHRDYSIHTQGMPIQLQIYPDHLTLTNPGGLYGRLTLGQLGKIQADTRNPVIANAMELLGLAENRYSGIPTVEKLMARAGALPPLFEDKRGEFCVTLYPAGSASAPDAAQDGNAGYGGQDGALGPENGDGAGMHIAPQNREAAILRFCAEPRTRVQIATMLDLGTPYTMQRYIKPLVDSGRLELSIPKKPSSSLQTYRSTVTDKS